MENITLYEWVTIYQGIMSIASLVFLTIMFRQRPGYLSNIVLCIAFFAATQNIGYFMELRSVNLSQAMTAVRFEYMGGAFVTTSSLLFIRKYCGGKVILPIYYALYIYDLIILMAVWLSDYTKIYYKGCTYVYYTAIPHLYHGNGPLFIINIVLTLGQLLAATLISIKSFFKTTDNIKKKIYVIFFLSMFIPVIEYFLGMSNLLQGFDPVPSGVALGVMSFCLAIVFQNVFEVVSIAYERVVQQMDEAIIVLNAKQNIVDINTSAYNRFWKDQMSPEEVLPFGDDDVIMSEAVREILVQVESEDEGYEYVKDDRIYDVHVNLVKENNILVGYVMLFIDITERKRQMEYVKGLMEAANRADQAKSDFLARMSHEIRTPINAVIGMNEMIIRESSEMNIKKYALEINSSANSLLHIVNDILDSSKIESGKMEIVETEYELSSLINDMYQMSRIRAQAKDLVFEVDVDKTIPTKLMGDDMRIRQVLLNILSNAVKYTEKGKVIFRIGGKISEDRTTMMLRCEVEDTGIGIRKEDMEKLFSPFERLDIKKNRNINGTGLGMSITRQLLEMMNSELKVESEYGKGSKFYFDIEQKVVSAEPIGDFKDRMHQIIEGHVRFRTYIAPEANILVVDDNDVNRKVFCGLLKRTEVKVTDIGSGEECLKLVQKEHYDIIFLDHMMPGMDGMETFEKMKKLENNLCSDTPVVMFTANEIAGAREEYLEMGFDSFLSKPIVPDILEDMVKNLLPPELVVEGEEMNDMVQDNFGIEEFPAIQDMDWEYAKLHMPDLNILKQNVKEFYKSTDKIIEEIEALFANVDSDVELYRIKVHSLKSTAALIGALLVSNLAKAAEYAAKESNRERIRAIHPIMIEELKKLKERMGPYCDDEPVREKAVDMSETEMLLEQLKRSLTERDYDNADEIMEQIDLYKYEDKIDKYIRELSLHVLNLEAEAAIDKIDLILGEVR